MLAQQCLAASRDDKGGSEFTIDLNQFAVKVATNISPVLAELLDYQRILFVVVTPHGAIDLDIPEVSERRVADQCICPAQSSEAACVRGTRWHVLRFIDEHTRERTNL